MTRSPSISLLITTRDRKSELLSTLRVMQGAMPPDNEILLFVDGSSDGTAAAVMRGFQTITVIEQHPGVGLIAARNRLMSAAKGKFAITLDDDAEIVTPGFVPLILEHFANHPRCGVIALAIHWGASPPSAQTCEAEDQACRTKSFVGCGHVWRTEAWMSIPNYPEWFEMYGEEDFAALQLLKRGWEVHYLPQVVVHHRVAGRSKRTRERLWRYRRQLRSGLFLILLFLPLLAIPGRLLYAFWIQIRKRILEQRDWAIMPMLLLVVADLMRHLPRLLRSRTALSKAQFEQWTSLPPARVYQHTVE